MNDELTPVRKRCWTTVLPDRGRSQVCKHDVTGAIVFVDDIDRHYDHVAARGARIVVEPHTHAGDRRYQVEDLEGHQWTFAQRVSEP